MRLAAAKQFAILLMVLAESSTYTGVPPHLTARPTHSVFLYSGALVIVLEKNHSYSGVIGNLSMPYLNSLAQKYELATQYSANAHHRFGNYFELTAGQIITNND